MALLFDSWLVELGAVVIATCAGIYLYLARSFQYWKERGVPYIEPSFPFGNLTDMMLQRKPIADAFRSMYWKLEGHKLGGIYQMFRPALLIRDPELIKFVLVKDFGNFHDHGTYLDEKKDPISGNLFFLEGIRWKHLRNKLTPTFTSGKMKMMFPTLVECGKELQAYLAPLARSKETIEVKDVLAKYSTDIIASCAFGIESNCLKNPDSEFRRMGRKAIEPSFYTISRDLLSILAPKLAAILKIPSTPSEVSKFFMGIVKETLEYREKFKVSRKDFMQLMIAIKNKTTVQEDPLEHNHQTEDINAEQTVVERNMYDVNGMTTNEIAAQAFVFFLAGFETSSTAMSFCLYELALNQDIQDRLRHEVDSVLAEHDGQLTYEAMQKMEYMDRVVAETLRKYPPAPLLVRSCNKECQLPGSEVMVERDTSIIVSVYALHHDPQYYPNPEEFDPERFTEEAKSRRHHYVYLPFGEGPRICIGSRFALMTIKIGIASFISSYQVKVCKKLTPIPLVIDKQSFMLSPKGGMHLQISERSGLKN